MSRTRQGYLLRGVAILIAAVFSGAWTFSVAGIGGLSSVAADEDTSPAGLPDGSSVPAQAIDAPASLSDTDALTGGNSASIIAASSTNGIPSAALAAYQRAETVINKADPTCNLTWQLIAAIGRVESDHGRVHGNVLDNDGVATPGIYGPALNGTAGTRAISDTDGGQVDSDAKWDRAVGPMQFIPSTWSVVGVDADGDGIRNPQDIDDAALAAAVYLCSGDDDLSTLEGQKAAIYRYNNSTSYVDLVLEIMEQYLSGDYTSVSGAITAGGYVVPDPTYNPPPAYNPPKGTNLGDGWKNNGSSTKGGSNGSTGGDTGGTGGEGDGDGDGDGGTGLPGDGDTGGTTGGLQDTTKKVTEGLKETTEKIVKGDLGGAVDEGTKTVDETVKGLAGTIEKTLLVIEAPIECTKYANNNSGGLLLDAKNYNAAYNQCMDSYGL